MWQLNLPAYIFNIKYVNNKQLIFDSQRKKYVVLTPEEWVRQHLIRFLIEEKKYPAALLVVEQQIMFNGMRKRCDAVVYNQNAEPLMIIECKAPTVVIRQATFDQVAVYNSSLNVPYYLISNGLQHFCVKINAKERTLLFLNDIPELSEIFL